MCCHGLDGDADRGEELRGPTGTVRNDGGQGVVDLLRCAVEVRHGCQPEARKTLSQVMGAIR